MQVQRHGMEIDTGYQTFKHEHDAIKRPRDYKRLYGQKKVDFIFVLIRFSSFHCIPLNAANMKLTSRLFVLDKLPIMSIFDISKMQKYYNKRFWLHPGLFLKQKM